MAFKSFAEHLLNLILPARCPITGDIVPFQGALSPEGFMRLQFISDPICHHCGFPFAFDEDVSNPLADQKTMICASCIANPPLFDQGFSAVTYNDTSRDLILRFKHGDQTYLTKIFVSWLQEIIKSRGKDYDKIIPVPLHFWRLLHRRYNQSLLLALDLSQALSIPVDSTSLKRVRHTKTQGHLSAQEREQNIKHAFCVPAKKIKNIQGKKILLIDDVYTTGSTLNECTKTLKEAGALSVDVVTVARVVRGE
jgi:ComF family protein